MKIKEGIIYDKNALKVLGIVEIDGETKAKQGDHALVMLFQPFKGKWMQTIAAFLTKGAATGKQLAKLVIDGITRLEQIGIKVDVVVSDGAPWNRTMWSEVGMLRTNNEKELDIEEEDILAGLETEEWETTLNLDSLFSQDDQQVGDDATNIRNKDKSRSGSVPPKKGKTKNNASGRKTGRSKSAGQPKQTSKAKLDQEHRSKFVSAEHPLDQKRRLWFVSDFPHLIKSVKERILHREILQVSTSTQSFCCKKVFEQNN